MKLIGESDAQLLIAVEKWDRYEVLRLKFGKKNNSNTSLIIQHNFCAEQGQS